MFFIWRFSSNFISKIKVIENVLVKRNYATAEQATFETKEYLLHKLDSSPSRSVTVSREKAIELFRKMVIIRRLEADSANMYKEKVIRGFCHLYSGQEAVCVGIKDMLRPQDLVISAYRAHGWAYIMSGTILSVLAELTGRHSGCSRGKGGSMHMYGKQFYGGNGIVGSQVSMGTGLALAIKYRGTDAISVTLYGDGAANQGQVFESFNIAKLWNLPVLYICENNKYGLGTSVSRASACTDFYTRGDYIPGIRIDGMDVLAVREATRYGMNYIIEQKKGPIILEMMTYRYFGHSMSDPGTSYRTREEIDEVRQHYDPITTFKDKLIKANLCSEDEIKKINKDVRKEVDDAAKSARTDTEIGVEELTADVYSNPLRKSIRNNVPWNKLPHKIVGKAINL